MIDAARAFVRHFREPILPDTVETMRRRLDISRNDATASPRTPPASDGRSHDLRISPRGRELKWRSE